VRQTDDRRQIADLELCEAALAQQQIRDRSDRVRLVVAAEDTECRERKREPAQRRAGPRVIRAGDGPGTAHGKRRQGRGRAARAARNFRLRTRRGSALIMRVLGVMPAYSANFDLMDSSPGGTMPR